MSKPREIRKNSCAASVLFMSPGGSPDAGRMEFYNALAKIYYNRGMSQLYPRPQHHILLIEDDPAIARAVQDGLEREGYQVTWCSTSGEGVNTARTAKPHMVILDVRLPDGSGFDACLL